jgi:cytochrome c553
VHGSLRAYANRSRFSAIMNGVAANLTDDTMRQVAAYYEGLPARSGGAVTDERAIAAGATIAAQGVPDLDIPACAECHGPTETPKNPAYPRLAGQPARYLASQLELMKQRRRGGSANVNLMEAFVDRLRPDHIRNVTLYYSSLAR